MERAGLTCGAYRRGLQIGVAGIEERGDRTRTSFKPPDPLERPIVSHLTASSVQPSKYSHVAELRSSLDNSRPASSMFMRLLNAGQVKHVNGQTIHCTVPYIRSEVPVVVVFRALGFVADRDILEHIVCDFSDPQLMEKARTSRESQQGPIYLPTHHVARTRLVSYHPIPSPTHPSPTTPSPTILHA